MIQTFTHHKGWNLRLRFLLVPVLFAAMVSATTARIDAQSRV